MYREYASNVDTTTGCKAVPEKKTQKIDGAREDIQYKETRTRYQKDNTDGTREKNTEHRRKHRDTTDHRQYQRIQNIDSAGERTQREAYNIDSAIERT